MEKQLVTFKVTTREMYDSFVATYSDMVFDEPSALNSDMMRDTMNALARAIMEDIRKEFVAGQGVFLVPKIIDAIDNNDDTKEYEIRVYDRLNRLIRVVIDSEIVF
jgi:hypothetical protein